MFDHLQRVVDFPALRMTEHLSGRTAVSRLYVGYYYYIIQRGCAGTRPLKGTHRLYIVYILHKYKVRRGEYQ